MYGLLFESIQFFVNQDYGEEVWTSVLQHASLENAVFITKKTYPDEWMVNLAKSTQHIIQAPSVDDIMFYFGTCFVSFCCRLSYDKILRIAGRTYRDFLYEIDNIHETIRFSHPKMQSPLFTVQSEDRNGCILIYRSLRTGFTYYVKGQLVQCARKFYQVNVDISVLDEIITDKGCHVTLRLNFDNHAYSCQYSPEASSNHVGNYPTVRSDTFFKLFPFCLVFNSKMKMIGCGGRLADLLPRHRGLGSNITDMFNLRRPLVDFTWSNTMCLQRVIFEMSLRKSAHQDAMDDKPKTDCQAALGMKKLLLRGQMKFIKDWDAIAFLCTPIMSSLDDMQKAGMYLQDLNMFDNSRDLVMAGQQCASDIEYTMERQMAWSQRTEETLTKLDRARQRSDNLINSMLTKSIADRLKSGINAVDTCEAFSQVTILFSYLVQFSDICTGGTPFQVIQCVQNATEVFDKIVDEHQLFKVETLGDGVYMVAGGVPDRCEDHAQRVAGLALELADNAKHVKNPVTGNGMQVLIGMHTGSVVAGIVGKRTPQYCLFGDTVNTAARMQTNSRPGRIHLSKPCHDCLQGTEFATVFRGRLPIKGKGEMKTYWLIGREGEEATIAMCRTLQDEHNMRKMANVVNKEKKSGEQLPISSFDIANTKEDEAEFQQNLEGVLAKESTAEEQAKKKSQTASNTEELASGQDVAVTPKVNGECTHHLEDNR